VKVIPIQMFNWVLLVFLPLFLNRLSGSTFIRSSILMYKEESKSNLNMAIKSQSHVVDDCTTDMLCPPA
jgi:hypothetical protein